ncbi:MAG: hypothetical protein R3C14_31220 [Caldilineaceae bacterium]
MNFFANLHLAQDLAGATGGVLMQWTDPDLALAATLQDVQGQLSCTPQVDTDNPSTATGAQEVCLIGQHFWPGATIHVGALEVPAASINTVNRDSALLCFDLPTGLEPGEQTIQIERPGAQPNAAAATIEVKNDTAAPSFRLYLPLLIK